MAPSIVDSLENFKLAKDNNFILTRFIFEISKKFKKAGIDESFSYTYQMGETKKEVIKNIDEIIEYMPSLLEKDKEIKFIVVGDGPYRKKLEKKVNKLNIENNVIFTGEIDSNDVYKYYQLGNVFVCASTSESQGLTYIEALASRMPMVCKKDDCLIGVIEQNKNGYIFENKDEFIKGVLNILNDNSLEIKMKNESFKKSNNFNKVEFGLKIEKVYKTILK